MEIYKKALHKGKQKIPRCNLLILGEERTGKTSLYRLLVRKKFNPNQDPTRGIDNNTVETVDTRHVASDTWEEKTSDDQKQQNENLFALGVVKEVKKELSVNKEVPSTETFHYSSKKLTDVVQSIRKTLADIEQEQQHQHQHEREFHQQLQSYEHRPGSHTGLKEVRPTTARVSSQINDTLPQASKQDTVSKTVKNEGDAEHKHTSENQLLQNHDERVKKTIAGTTTTTTPKKVTFADETLKTKLKSHSKEDTSSLEISSTRVQLSRSHSKEISKLMKSGDDEHRELPLTYNALDFAGQKEYHPMHHCFITRRAIYLVVFNLQKMIDYIEGKKQANEVSSFDLHDIPIANNPLEQVHYWLHSIRAHVFPPYEGDLMRRVCLVGTHRAPKGGKEITEEKLKQIDDELRKTLERDQRCVSHLHYTAEPERMFIAVENSMDSKEEREQSGALQLQRELKEISDNLVFLKEDHPIIWLNFEAQLVELCKRRKKKRLSAVVPKEEVLTIASQQGIEAEDDQRLALGFLHDTGKVVYLGKFDCIVTKYWRNG